MTLTKEHIVSAVAEANRYSRIQAVELVEKLLEVIKSTLESASVFITSTQSP